MGKVKEVAMKEEDKYVEDEKVVEEEEVVGEKEGGAEGEDSILIILVVAGTSQHRNISTSHPQVLYRQNRRLLGR